MKICLLSARFPPQRCGVGDYTCYLACALARVGHDVDVITCAGLVDDMLYPLPPNVHVRRVVSSWTITGLPDVLRHLRKVEPELLLIQYTPHAFQRRGITFAVNLLSALVRATSGVRVVTNFHELYIPFDRSMQRNLGAVWQRVTALLLALGSHTLCVTASEWQRRLKGLGVGKPVQLIPVGSNIPLTMTSAEDRARLRRQLLGSSDLLVASFGARHDRDVPGVLYALRELNKLVRARLLWVGGGSLSGPDRVSIEETVRLAGLHEGDVTWTGDLPHPEVSRVLSVCDLMMLAFVDGVSTRRTSAMTAFQHGLPLLTTYGNTLAVQFVHRANTYLVPNGNRQALADGLIELGTNPELRTRIARGGRALYEAAFTWDVIAKQVLSLTQD